MAVFLAKSFFTFSVLLSAVSLVSSKSKEDEPTLLSQSGQQKVALGESVILPCRVDNLGTHHLVWLRNDKILGASNTSVNHPRARVLSGFTLQLSDVKRSDGGRYSCLIVKNSGENKIVARVDHQLEVLEPPTVVLFPPNRNITVKSGQPTELRCEVKGHPIPHIAWMKQDTSSPELHKVGQGHTFRIPRTERRHSGSYFCEATNGVGPPVRSIIDVHVLHKPEIEVVTPVIHSGPGYRAELYCIVHAYPPAQVTWYFEGNKMENFAKSPSQISSFNSGNLHSIIIQRVWDFNLGVYLCEAVNSLGSATKTIEVTGLPKPAIFRSKSSGKSPTNYTAIWSVESFSSIVEYRFLFRKVVPSESSSKVVDSWKTIIVPADDSSGTFLHSKSYTLVGLPSNTSYEAVVQSRNQYGWSHASKPFVFRTNRKANDKYLNDQPSQLVEAALSQGCSSFSTFIHNPVMTILVVLAFVIK